MFNDPIKEPIPPIELAEKGEGAKVAESAGNFNNYLQNQQGIILAAFASKGRWGKIFGNKKDKKNIPEDFVAKLVADIKMKRENLRNLTEQLKVGNVEAMELLRGSDGKVALLNEHDFKRFPELKKLLINTFETESAKGLEGALKVVNVIPALYRNGMYINNNEDIRINETLRGAVKKNPELLQALDKVLPFDESNPCKRNPYVSVFTNYNQCTYLELASASVTGSGFRWEDLNLKRLSPKIRVGTYDNTETDLGGMVDAFKFVLGGAQAKVLFDKDLVEKHLDLKEQITILVSAAENAAKTNSGVTLMPKEFEKFVKGEAREKLAKKIKKLRNNPERNNNYIRFSTFDSIVGLAPSQKASSWKR